MLTADTTVTQSLFGESNSDYRLTKAACWPLPLNRHELGAQVSNLEVPGSKPGGSADSPTAHQSPRPVPPRASRSYKERPVVGPGGSVSPARFERALPTSSRWCLLPLGYEDREPPPGADPGHPPYEGGAAAVRGGKATGAGIEPAWPRFRALMGCQQPTRYR